jgi:peptide/nickel transport system permease protein
MKPVLTLAARRLVYAIGVLFVLSVLVKALVFLLPGDPAKAIAGEEASPERIAQIRQAAGLDKPFIQQYTSWLGKALRGDLGESLYTGESIATLIKLRIPVSLSLAVVALAFAVVLGVGLGTIAGLRPNSLVDRVVTFLASLGIAVPSFWVGMLLIADLGIERKLLPPLGYAPIADGLWEWLRHLLLPGFALATSPIAVIARQARSAVRDTMQADFVRTARAKGLSGVRVVGKHVFKNSSMTTVTVIGNVAGVLLGGAIVIEQLFVLPGLGTMMLRAATTRDFPLIQASVLFVAVIVLVINVLVDLSYLYFNPKLRTS